MSSLLGVSGVLCCLTPIPGLIVGIWSLHKIGTSNGRLRGKGIAWFGICASVITTLWQAAMLPIYPSRKIERMHTCCANMKQQAAAITLYANDNNGRLPLAETWCDAIKPMVKTPARAFNCPELGRGEMGGYAFNSGLSKARREEIKWPAHAVMVFEGRPGWNISGASTALATPRHSGYWNFLFADGHLQWLNQKALSQPVWNPAKAARPKPGKSEPQRSDH